MTTLHSDSGTTTRRRTRARELEDAAATLLAHLSDAISVQWILSAADAQLQFTRLARAKATDIRQSVYWMQVAADACHALPALGEDVLPSLFREYVHLACRNATQWAERLEGFPLIWDESRHEVIVSAISATAVVRGMLQVLIDAELAAEAPGQVVPAGPPILTLLRSSHLDTR